jgi:hypothetical protein
VNVRVVEFVGLCAVLFAHSNSNPFGCVVVGFCAQLTPTPEGWRWWEGAQWFIRPSIPLHPLFLLLNVSRKRRRNANGFMDCWGGMVKCVVGWGTHLGWCFALSNKKWRGMFLWRWKCGTKTNEWKEMYTGICHIPSIGLLLCQCQQFFFISCAIKDREFRNLGHFEDKRIDSRFYRKKESNFLYLVTL